MKYYHANRKSINRKRREKTAQARQLKAAQQSIDTSTVGDGIDDRSKPKKYDWALYKRRQRARAKEELAKKDFWASPDISRTTPNKKDIVRKRLAPKTYVTHPKQILEKTQTEAFLEFKQKYPQTKMGQRTFESCGFSVMYGV